MKKTSEVLNGCVEKIKVSSAEIVVHGTKDKPYYEIKYRDLSDGQIYEGYSSYNLDYVFEWLKECFEILSEKEINRMSISEQVKELRYKADIYNTLGSAWELNRAEAKKLQSLLYQAADTIESLSSKLADMEQPAGDCGGGWIYCGDGKNLPQPGKRYRVTVLWKDGDFEMSSVYDLVYGADGVWHGESYVPVSFGVVAWKPLEEPYKENLNEQTRKSILGVAQMSDKAWANYRKEQRIARKARRK